jgi:hypothetical protein
MSYLFNNEVGFVGNAVDAFNRLRVSQPFTLFDSQHRYQLSDKWDTFSATGGYVDYLLNESVKVLGVTLTVGSKTTSETKRVFAYQPGKSLLIINTFVWPTKIHGLRRRVGYFGITGGATAGIPYNGVYLEQNGLTLSINLASGSLNTTLSANQSDWNGDKFDGTGASGRTLDTSKGNIFWTDIEWLGVGDVRTGFFVDGRPVIAHTFHNDNTHPTAYMTTACLPLRHEIENLTGLTGSQVSKQICSTVISEGGYEGFSRRFNVTKNRLNNCRHSVSHYCYTSASKPFRHSCYPVQHKYSGRAWYKQQTTNGSVQNFVESHTDWWRIYCSLQWKRGVQHRSNQRNRRYRCYWWIH